MREASVRVVDLDDLDGVAGQRDEVEQQQPPGAALALADGLRPPDQRGKADQPPTHVDERRRVQQRGPDPLGVGAQLGLDRTVFVIGFLPFAAAQGTIMSKYSHRATVAFGGGGDGGDEKAVTARKQPSRPGGAHPPRHPGRGCSRFRRARLRRGHHQPDRGAGRAVHRLAVPVLPEQGRDSRRADRRAHRGRHDLLINRHWPPGCPSHSRTSVRLFVRAAIDNHVEQPALHRVLFEEAPRSPALLERIHQHERAVVAVTENCWPDHPEVRVGDTESPPGCCGHHRVAGAPAGGLAHADRHPSLRGRVGRHAHPLPEPAPPRVLEGAHVPDLRGPVQRRRAQQVGPAPRRTPRHRRRTW